MTYMDQPALDAGLLQALIAPRSVALIGVSGGKGKLTARPLEFLQMNGWEGEIYPVNPTRDEIAGLKAYKSVRDIPAPVDHAYILLNADPAIEALRDCAAAGVKVVSVLADGFAEAGDEGRARQELLVSIAKEAGILMIGPNSTGVVVTNGGFVCTTNAAFKVEGIKQGRLAVLSQSGSVIGTMLSRGAAEGIGFSALISTGNEAASGVARLGKLLVDDPNTDGFILFLETIRDREALTEFAREAAARGKPIVAYMIGRSEEGQALSVSHTGALTGSARSMSAYLRSVGIREVQSFETLIPAAATLARLHINPARPKTLTVVSTTGGGGAMVLDQIALRGVEIGALAAEPRRILEEKGIPLGHGKLVDVTLAGTKYDSMKAVIDTLCRDPETGTVLVVIGSSAQFNPELAVAPIVDACAEAPEGSAAVLAFPLPHALQALEMLESGAVPAFRSVTACAETIALLFETLPVALLPQPLAGETRQLIDKLSEGMQDEVTSGAVMKSLGIEGPRSIFLTPGQSVPQDLGTRWPVVAKLVSSDLPHKTEAGAIRIGIRDRALLLDAIDQMTQSGEAYHPGMKLRGILIQEMAEGLGEALIGVTRDPVAGPMVTLAMGGVMTEIYRDSAVRPAPVDVETARQMIDEVKGFALFSGYRNCPKGDLEALAQAVSAVSQLALSARVAEAEINPVLVKSEGEGVVMLDALLNITDDV